MLLQKNNVIVKTTHIRFINNSIKFNLGTCKNYSLFPLINFKAKANNTILTGNISC